MVFGIRYAIQPVAPFIGLKTCFHQFWDHTVPEDAKRWLQDFRGTSVGSEMETNDASK